MQSSESRNFKTLSPKGRLVLANALGDSPQTVIAVHVLRTGLCKAYVAGVPSQFKAAIVQSDFLPDELMGFGSNAQALYDLLELVRGWKCVNVSTQCATSLGKVVEEKMGLYVRYYDDLYLTLLEPVVNFQNMAVRCLTLSDLLLLESAASEVQQWARCFFGSPHRLLSEGIVACAFESDRIVSISHTSARTERYADMGAFTLEKWWCRGLATVAASVVAARVQEAGQVPVWSTGEGNVASLRVAHKLGFKEVSRSTYVILEKDG